MAIEKVSFIATKYKNKPTMVRFYTKKGDVVRFSAQKKAPVKQVVEFKAKSK
ncbi:MAG: hypothetical protein WC505_01915 [Patescibacteria group bacterium]